MKTLLSSNDARYRLARTIIQGVIGVIIANLDMIVDMGPFAPEVKALIVALTMAVLSPIMAYFGTEPEVIPEEVLDGDNEE